MIKGNFERFNNYIDDFTGFPPEYNGDDLITADEAIDRLLFDVDRLGER